VLNSGAGLYCYGYISGMGTVRAKSGSTVYEAFQIRSWRGGSATSGMKDNSQKVFPIVQYYVQNIEVPITFERGASGKVYTSVNMSSRAYPASASFIGTGGLFQLSSGSLTRSFDGPTDRTTYEVNGNLSVTNMSLSIPGLPLVGTLDLNTADYVLPINSNITINIKSGNTTINQDIALLPATVLTIGESANLSIANGKRVYVYDKDEWGPYAADSAQLIVVGYSVANGTATKRTNASMVDSIVDVNGTLNAVNGKIYTTASGASITSSLKSGKVIITAGSETKTNQATQSGTDITYVDIPIESAKLHNGDDSYTATAQANNTTYFYCSTHNKWETGGYVITFNSNGGSGTMPDQNVCTGENAINENTFTNEGLVFAGWNTKADGSGTSYDDKQVVAFTGNTTLYAQWTEHVHTWGEPSYQWSENNASVTATRVCQDDNTHVESETVETTSEETTAPSCTETGVRTYTATFTNPAFVFQTKTETIAALGHDFGEWTVTTQPTCTEAGEETRTCSRCNAKETRPVDALGHTPGEARKENETAATCTEKGAYDLVVRCT
ncbi:MAG: InlB B-repeat-containing protein, partial [Erysipelotrichaceae bacterium]|nr:InlB B-repeat-containing protein [Erysipelotrichaceae bacterium]